VLQTEEHLVRCGSCHERVSLSQALHISTRRAVHSAALPSRTYEERVRAALAAERAREQAGRAEQDRRAQTDRGKPLPWRTVVPVAAAAAIALAFASNKSENKRASASSNVVSTQAGISSETSEESLIEELIKLHASSPAPQVTEPTLMPQLERRLGLRVQLPMFNQAGARWQGGSVVPVRNEPAASLFYHIDKHRLTMYIFDAERVPLRNTRVLKPQVVRDRPVFVGTKRGYSIAAIENRGVGYAIATDLDAQESAELVASIH
jgi:anti-sigma factor RsiW